MALESKIHEEEDKVGLETVLHMIPETGSTCEWLDETWLVMDVGTEEFKLDFCSSVMSWSYWAWEIDAWLIGAEGTFISLGASDEQLDWHW